jgi:hypothetical protein
VVKNSIDTGSHLTLHLSSFLRNFYLSHHSGCLFRLPWLKQCCQRARLARRKLHGAKRQRTASHISLPHQRPQHVLRTRMHRTGPWRVSLMWRKCRCSRVVQMTKVTMAQTSNKSNPTDQWLSFHLVSMQQVCFIYLLDLLDCSIRIPQSVGS